MKTVGFVPKSFFLDLACPRMQKNLLLAIHIYTIKIVTNWQSWIIYEASWYNIVVRFSCDYMMKYKTGCMIKVVNENKMAGVRWSVGGD